MRLRALLTLCLGLLVAASAVAYTHFTLQAPNFAPAMQDVIVARTDIAFGDLIDETKLAVQSWPANAMPDGVFIALDQVLPDGQEKPRRAKRAISAGELVLSGKLSDYGEQVTITEQIDPGMRAVAIRVDDVTGVAGFVGPADRVDITLTRTVDQNLTTATILQHVKVIGLDQVAANARKPQSSARTVTVQVGPSEVQKLALAQQAGTLSLSLRNLDAVDRPVLEAIGVRDLTEEGRPKPLPERRASPSVMVNRAGERSKVDVPRG